VDIDNTDATFRAGVAREVYAVENVYCGEEKINGRDQLIVLYRNTEQLSFM
jgi:hypothetical protein